MRCVARLRSPEACGRGRVKDEVSIIVKTFERTAAIERLLHSILLSSAAQCRILVGDASREPVLDAWPSHPNVERFRLPFDSGLSYGRNFLVDRVTTPYCVVLDDDLLFTEETRLELLLALVKEHGFDLAAGEGNLLVRGQPGHANIERAGRKLRLVAGAKPRALHNGLPVYDMVSNFFLATTGSVRDIRWDEQFPVYGNHIDFFMRYSAKYRVTYTDRVVVQHIEGGYTPLGNRSKYGAGKMYQTSRRFARKHGVDQYGDIHLRGVRGLLDVFVPAAWAAVRRAPGLLLQRLGVRERPPAPQSPRGTP